MGDTTSKVSRSDPDWDARGRAWWSHVRVLADDSMEGRDTGSAGYQRAADYVIEQFRSAGLEPAGIEGYRQPVDFDVFQLDEAASSLSLVRDGSTYPLTLRKEAQIVATSGTAPELEAGVVFAGYGLEIPEYGYSDLDGLDLRGKIAVYFRGGPAELPAPVRAHYQSWSERARAMRKAGAVGTALMLDPNVPDLPWDRLAAWLPQPRMDLKEVDPEDPLPLSLALFYNPEHLDLLLAGSGHTAAEVMAGLGKPGPIPRFPLDVRLRARAKVNRSTARCTNVVGVLPGSDPALRSEYVVGTGHLDHLGIGEPVNGDSIYSGAMDNASGVAALIEMARVTKESGERPKRSLLFLAVTGEEKGLLGSEYFAKHPSVAGPLVADLNVDMFLPLYPLKHLEVPGLGESSLGQELKDLAGPLGVEAHPEHIPDQVTFIRSDQYNFVKKGIPSLMISVGYAKGTPEEEGFKSFLRDRYHAPADDADQPVNFATAGQFVDLVRRLMLQVANDPERPRWNSDSFFRKFAR